jgi:hypothetical protein
MHYQVLMNEALAFVLDRGIPDEAIGNAVLTQARAMAGSVWD